jgi:hypothetical protein
MMWTQPAVINSAPCGVTFRPDAEQQYAVLVSTATLHEAERLIDSLEGCNPEGAEIPFDNIFDRVTGADPSVTDYVLGQPGK